VGWKTQTMLVRPCAFVDEPAKLLSDLGYASPVKLEETEWADAGAGSIWIGTVGDCLVLYTALAWGFFEDQIDQKSRDFNAALVRRFPEAEIAALTLHSVVGGWGFAVWRQGSLIRHQHGYDGMVLRDEGARLPAEETYLASLARREVEGVTLYRHPGYPEADDMTHADLGEPLVFEIVRAFTGYPLDQLNHVRGTNFWLSEDERQQNWQAQRAARAGVSSPRDRGIRPWWKFWS